MTDIQTYRILINGVWVDSDDGNTFESVYHAKGKRWALIAETTASDIDKPVLATNRVNCQHSWADMKRAINGPLNANFGVTDHNCPVGSRLYLQDSTAGWFLNSMVGQA